MRFYETIYIVDPNLENMVLEKTMTQIEDELQKTKAKIIAANIINDMISKGVSSPKFWISTENKFIPIKDPTKTGPAIVPMLLAAPNFPIPAERSSSDVMSAT